MRAAVAAHLAPARVPIPEPEAAVAAAPVPVWTAAALLRAVARQQPSRFQTADLAAASSCWVVRLGSGRCLRLARPTPLSSAEASGSNLDIALLYRVEQV